MINALPKLTDIKEMFILRVHVVMSACRLSKGNIGCISNVLNTQQDVQVVLNKLPLLLSDLLIFFARKSSPNNSNGCKDFHINRDRMFQ